MRLIFYRNFLSHIATIGLPFHSCTTQNINGLKQLITGLSLLFSVATNAQKIDSIYVHLYTDSLKKGTYNYINIDGKLSNGHYLPLDSSQIIFSASDGKFFGNSLWIAPDFKKEKVSIHVVLRSNPAMKKSFIIFVKKKPDPELKTEDDILQQPSVKSRKRRH